MSGDPYLYPGTDTLKNHMGIRDAGALAVVEANITHLALVEVVEMGVPGDYDLAHLQEFHRRIFSDIYPWAGEIRTIDIAKGMSLFGYAPDLKSGLDERFAKLRQENYLRDLSREQFVDRLTYYLGEVNLEHPFREGNGRTQRAFFGQLARDAGYRIAWEHLDAERNIEAFIASHSGDNEPLRTLLDELVVERGRDRDKKYEVLSNDLEHLLEQEPHVIALWVITQALSAMTQQDRQHQQGQDLDAVPENTQEKQPDQHSEMLQTAVTRVRLRYTLDRIAAERDANATQTIHHYQSQELNRSRDHEYDP